MIDLWIGLMLIATLGTIWILFIWMFIVGTVFSVINAFLHKGMFWF